MPAAEPLTAPSIARPAPPAGGGDVGGLGVFRADPRAVHARLREERAASVARWDRWDRRLAAARGLTFLAGSAVAAGWGAGAWSGWPLAVPGATFAGLWAAHEAVAAKRAAAGRGVAHHAAALARVGGADDPTADPGADLPAGLPPDAAPTAADLDLFGPRSVFAALSCARTAGGRRTLAAWLTASADPAAVRDRQDAADALAGAVALRERLARLPGSRNAAATAPLLPPPRPVPAAARAAAAALGAGAVGGLIYWLGFGGSVAALLVAAGGQTALQLAFRDRVTGAAAYAEGTGGGLTLLAGVLGLLETCDADAPAVSELKSGLGADPAPSAAVARLAALDRRLGNSLNNQFVALAGAAFALPLFHAHAVARWAGRHGDRLPAWADAAGRFEALLSLARWRFERPAFARPDVAAGPPRFRARGLGHPLLASAACVRNDVAFAAGADSGAPALLLVSGSNMSGKSTLLRAVGVNAALAQAGAAVCAASLALAPCRVRSVMRVADSLADGKSLFFESVRRLAAVLGDAARPGPPVLFLLDEILQGTNSADRLTGANAVIRTLLDRGGSGLVTTHDLALTEVAAELGATAANVHFRDQLSAGRMTFDHRLRPGVVPKSNALELMRLVGIVD